jgi:uncharacterized protein with HEPN domain
MRNDIIVRKIIDYIGKIIRNCDDVKCIEEFTKNTILVESCVFNLLQIGEIANKLDKDYAVRHDTIQWRALYGLRNRIVHDYEGVNFELIWQIIKHSLPETLERLKGLL